MQFQSPRYRQSAVRVLFLVLVDIFLINFANLATLLLLADFDIHSMLSSAYMPILLPYSIIVTIVTLLIFVPFKLYNSLWEFAGPDELVHIVAAGGVVLLLRLLAGWIPGLIPSAPHFRTAFPIISGIILIGLIGISRVVYRLLRNMLRKNTKVHKARTLLIGAGSAGAVALRE